MISSQKNINVKYPNNIKILREQMGFDTQRKFAKKIVIEASTISNWENGARIPQKHLRTLCEVLKCREKDLGLSSEYYDTIRNDSELFIMKTNLGLIMASRKITQQDLADMTGKSKQYISSISPLLPHTEMTLGAIEEIAKVLNVDLQSLKIPPMLKKQEKEDVKSFFRNQEDVDFEEAWLESKILQPRSQSMNKVLLVEDNPLQLKIWGKMIKNSLKDAKINNVLIQIVDKISCGVALMKAEDEDMKLVITDIMLSDTDNSLDYIDKFIPDHDCKIIVISAISDEDEINKIKSHPKVIGFIQKGNPSLVEMANAISMLNGALVEASRG